MNDALVLESLVTDVEVNKNIDKSLFCKPDGIAFEEFSIENMFGGMDLGDLGSGDE